jgi:hypothetical protein
MAIRGQPHFVLELDGINPIADQVLLIDQYLILAYFDSSE